MNQFPLLTVTFSLISLIASAPAMALSFSKAYVFGDSLSDPGNIFNVTEAVQPFTPLLGQDVPITPPTPPYDASGRFADGEIWVDFIAQELELDIIPSTQLTTSPITLIPQLGISFDFDGTTAFNSVNFAYGGAQSGRFGGGGLDSFIPGILTQVEGLVADLARVNQSADPDALYIIWGGANDYQIIPDADPVQSVDNLTEAVEILYDSGARHFLIPNLPDLGQTPRALLPNPPIPGELLTQRTNQHNQLLDESLEELSLLTDIEIVSVDSNSLFSSVLANPEDFGFTSLPPASCLQGEPLTIGVDTTNICSNPEEHIFWDFIHPTTANHKVFADFALETLNAQFEPTSVPEPNLPYLPLGLLGLGWCLIQKVREQFPIEH